MSDHDRPNVLLITTDQQRYDTLGATTGADWLRTPNLDRLAERGTLFERAYVQNPVCIPSRACLQTGRYPHQHGVEHMERVIDETPGLPDWEVTFMERLQAAGYRTGATGKLHMMPHKGFHYERLCNGKGARWTEYEGSELGRGPLGPTYASWLEERHPGGYDEIYEHRREDAYAENRSAVRNVLPKEEHVEHWVAEEAIEFLHDPHSDPFFLWCGFLSPHGPLAPPAPYDELYDPADVGLPARAEEAASPKPADDPWWGEDAEKIRRWRAHYWALVSFVDEQVGRLLDALEERGHLEETLILFTSDHGEMAGDYGRMAKGNFYEEVIRVPTIAVPPGGNDVDRTDGLIEVADLAPTILDYAGVDRPRQLPTHSLRPFLSGEADDTPRDSVLCEYLVDREDQYRHARCLRTDRYKYVFDGPRRTDQFYDLETDPEELHNRIDDPDYRGEVARHRELLLERLLHPGQSYYTDETPTDRELRSWLN